MAVLEANASNFNELIQGDYVVVDLYGTYCGACIELAPIFEAASVDLPLLRFAHMNIQTCEENEEIANYYNVKAIPTLLFFRKGELVHRVVGSMDQEMLDGYLAKLLYE